MDGSEFHRYLTVQPKDRFSYQNIYKNLRVVEHPPLYFMILHTICSFFPNSFNKWYAGALNIVIFMLIYIAIYKLAKRVIGDEILALCATIFWGFSVIGLSTGVFLRLYVLQTLLYLCLAYMFIKIIQENEASKKDLILVYLYSFLGIYNQYNAIFFSFFATVVAFIIFLKRKNIKLMLLLGGVMLLSVGTLFIVYPQVYDVLSKQWRAKQVLSNLTQLGKGSDRTVMDVFYDIDIRATYIIKMVSEQLLAFNTTNYKASIFCLTILSTILLCIPQKMKIEIKWLVATLILYIIYLFSMPYMHIFYSRYYMGIMPFIAILTIMFLEKLLNLIKLEHKKINIVVSILVLLNVLNLNFFIKSPYSFKWGQSEQDVYKKIQQQKVFIDRGQNFIWLHSMVYYLAKANKVYITEDICNEQAINNILNTEQPIILTYASYIPKKRDHRSISCLHNIGIKYQTTICASQHCYDVWEK